MEFDFIQHATNGRAEDDEVDLNVDYIYCPQPSLATYYRRNDFSILPEQL